MSPKKDRQLKIGIKMKRIRRIVKKENKVSAKGEEYTKYTYEIQNGHDRHEATAIQEYEPGEVVRTWFDGEYNTAKIGKLCQKCYKVVIKGAEINHEFCELPARMDYN